MRLPLPVSVRIVVNVCSTFCNAASILVPVKLPTPKAPEVIDFKISSTSTMPLLLRSAVGVVVS